MITLRIRLIEDNNLEAQLTNSALPIIDLPSERKINPDSITTIVSDFNTIFSSALVVSIGVKPELVRLGTELRGLLPSGISISLRQWIENNPELAYMQLTLDDETARLPWELMYDGEQFLCERFMVGRQLMASKNTNPPPNKLRSVKKPINLLVLANPTGSLPNADAEASAIDAAFESHPDIKRNRQSGAGGGITASAVQHDLLEYDVVIFAGHSDATSWHLSGGSFSSSHITSMRAAVGKFFPALILSDSCISGTVLPSIGSGNSSSLAREFLQAGVRHYIGTFWIIPDSMLAPLFSTTLLKELVDKNSPVGKALWEARRCVKNGKDPVLWAQYVLYGNPELTLVPSRVAPQPPAPAWIIGGYLFITKTISSRYGYLFQGLAEDDNSGTTVFLTISSYPLVNTRLDKYTAEKLLSIDYPGLVRILQIGLEDEKPFLVQEHHDEGETLRAFMERWGRQGESDDDAAAP